MYFRYGRSQVYPIAGAKSHNNIILLYATIPTTTSKFIHSNSCLNFPIFVFSCYFILFGIKKKEEQKKEEQIKYEPLEYVFFLFLCHLSFYRYTDKNLSSNIIHMSLWADQIIYLFQYTIRILTPSNP